MTNLSAAPPIEPDERPVGRCSTKLVDPARPGRTLLVDVWYPAQPSGEALTSYEPVPGIAFRSASAYDSPVVLQPPTGTAYPLILVSHGRTGMRFAYALLCEALASRGFVVVAADHPGDALGDWLGGTFVDDRTNEVGRVADSGFLLDVFLDRHSSESLGEFPEGLLGVIDADRVAEIGHSYGAYTALAAAAGARGVAPDRRLKAVVCLQPYTRSMSDTALARVVTPTLLVISEFDRTTPAATDGDRPWQIVPASPTWRVDLGGAAHHAASDMGLYLELAAQITDLPPIVVAYVAMMNGEMTGPQFRPWREGLLLQIRVIAAFLDIVLDIDAERGEREVGEVQLAERLTLQRR